MYFKNTLRSCVWALTWKFLNSKWNKVYSLREDMIIIFFIQKGDVTSFGKYASPIDQKYHAVNSFFYFYECLKIFVSRACHYILLC